jgi:hypothetical protein
MWLATTRQTLEPPVHHRHPKWCEKRNRPMFCGNCGSKAVEGDRFCVACGRAQRSSPSSESIAVMVLEKPEAPVGESIADDTVENLQPMDQTASAGTRQAQAAGKPSYCKHSANERTSYGVDRRHGSEICLNCELPYFPGSPLSVLGPPGSVRAVAQATAPADGRPNTLFAPGPPPSNHLTWAWVSTLLFCWPLGIPAIVYANRVDLKWAAGDVWGARQDSQQAQTFAVLATCIGVVLWVIILADLSLNS